MSKNLFATIFLPIFFFCTIAISQITQNFEMYGAKNEAGLKELSDMGFTQVILDKHWLHSKASELGLKVVLANWWSVNTQWEEIEKTFRLAQTVKSLSSISMMDKPDFYNPPLHPGSLYIDIRKKLKALDPKIALSLSHWGPLRRWPKDWDEEAYLKSYRLFYEAVDEMRIMPYPLILGDPLSEVPLMMARSRRLMERTRNRVPLTVILQSWTESNEDPIPLLPTIPQLRVMAYSAILSEAYTLSFYDYNIEVWNRVPGFTSGFKKLIRELRTVADIYRGALVETNFSSNGVVLKSQLRSRECVTCIFINTSPYPVDGLNPYEIKTHRRPCSDF